MHTREPSPDMLATFGSHIHFVSECVTYTLTRTVSQSTVDPSARGGHTRLRVPATPSPHQQPWPGGQHLHRIAAEPHLNCSTRTSCPDTHGLCWAAWERTGAWGSQPSLGKDQTNRHRLSVVTWVGAAGLSLSSVGFSVFTKVATCFFLPFFIFLSF